LNAEFAEEKDAEEKNAEDEETAIGS